MNATAFPDTAFEQAAEHRFEFDSPQDSVARLAAGTVAIPLVNLRLIRAAGEDTVGFLHNLLSNDVKKLAAGALQWNSLNSPKGRMIASLLMWKQGEDLMLALPAELHGMVLKKLSMYVLRSKVRLSDPGAELRPVGLAGARAAAVLGDAGVLAPAANMSHAASGDLQVLRLADEHFIVLAPQAHAAVCWQRLLAAGAQPAGSAAWDGMLIRAGLPMIAKATQEEFVAQMLNFELIGGVSFTKGCYPGQEIVARTQYLGKLKKRMYRISVARDSAPLPGEDLFSNEFGEQSIGKIVLAAPAAEGGYEALAVLQSSSADAGGVRLGAPDGPEVRVLPLPYQLS